MLKTHTQQSKAQHSTAQNCSYDKYIIGNWKIEKSKKKTTTQKMKLLSLLFVFRMMHVAVCSCRLRRVRPVCVCELLVDWNFPGTQFVVENFTFLFPLDKYFSFTMKCAPSLALSAKLKNKPKLNESSTLWSNEWTSMVLKSFKSSLLNRMSAPQNAYARQSTSTVFYYVQHKRLNTIFLSFFKQRTQSLG